MTTAAGTYDITIAPVLSDGTPLRIEFTGYPAGFVDSFNGTSNATSVQFTTVGATNVNFALHRTTDYSRGTSTPLLTAIQVNGSPDLDYGNTTAANAMEATIRSQPAITAVLPVNAVHTVTNPATVTNTLATFGEVGAIWGVAVQSLGTVAGGERFYVYASSVLRRHSGWGEASGSILRGIDGLYRLDVTVAANGTVTRNALVSYDLTAGAANYGTVTRDLADAQTASGVQSFDTAAYAAVGKVGIGGIQYYDGKLYVVNLNDRAVWAYDTASFGAGPASPTPTVISTGLSGNDRPWAITVRDDRLYLGVTNTVTLSTGSRVISRAISGGSWTTDLTVPLNYSRGISWAADPPGNPVTTGQAAAQWHAWEDNPNTIWNNANSTVTYFRAWAQPVLSGLSFDDGGNLALGFLDRFSIQTGAAALFPGGSGSGNAYNRSNVTSCARGRCALRRPERCRNARARKRGNRGHRRQRDVDDARKHDARSRAQLRHGSSEPRGNGARARTDRAPEHPTRRSRVLRRQRDVGWPGFAGREPRRRCRARRDHARCSGHRARNRSTGCDLV